MKIPIQRDPAPQTFSDSSTCPVGSNMAGESWGEDESLEDSL